MLFHVRFAGGVRRLVAGEGGAHERRFVGGSGQLPLRLADELGDRVVKVHAVYPEPFWRAEGLSGQLLSDVGPVNATFDNTPPPDGPASSWVSCWDPTRCHSPGATSRSGAVPCSPP